MLDSGLNCMWWRRTRTDSPILSNRKSTRFQVDILELGMHCATLLCSPAQSASTICAPAATIHQCQMSWQWLGGCVVWEMGELEEQRYFWVGTGEKPGWEGGRMCGLGSNGWCQILPTLCKASLPLSSPQKYVTQIGVQRDPLAMKQPNKR